MSCMENDFINLAVVANIMAVKYIMSDTDGCLVPEDKTRPPLEVDLSPYRPVLREIGETIRKYGLTASMCTVRSLAAGLPIREQAGINGPCGFENGNLIYIPNGESYMLAPKLFGRDGKKRVSAIQKLAETLYTNRENICERATVDPELVRPLVDRKVVLTWEWTNRDMNRTEAIWSVIKRDYLTNDVKQLIEDGKLLLSLSDIAFDLPPGITKADAARHMFQLTGFQKENTLGIGDRLHSDMPFMELTGNLGCPRNADEKLQKWVKEHDGHVSSYENGQGVLDILRYFVNQRL